METEAGKMFDRFYTVENAKGSTGLGLSIARLLWFVNYTEGSVYGMLLL